MALSDFRPEFAKLQYNQTAKNGPHEIVISTPSLLQPLDCSTTAFGDQHAFRESGYSWRSVETIVYFVLAYLLEHSRKLSWKFKKEDSYKEKKYFNWEILNIIDEKLNNLIYTGYDCFIPNKIMVPYKKKNVI